MSKCLVSFTEIAGQPQMKRVVRSAEICICANQKKLTYKTIDAYRNDIHQFFKNTDYRNLDYFVSSDIENYSSYLIKQFRPKTVKRKLASIRTFFHFLARKKVISKNPFYDALLKFREPIELPKTIPLHYIKTFLKTIYIEMNTAATPYRRRNALRDASICELLFCTGIRVSELCSIEPDDIDLEAGTILIHGKGAKERLLQIGSTPVVTLLCKYRDSYKKEIEHCNHFFANQSGNPFNDQAVRRMINHYTELAGIEKHITPHMFRHTFATSLLDADVDIRYIQEMLGHSSIHTTEIYTHVSLAKQKDILTSRHPRNHMSFGEFE